MFTHEELLLVSLSVYNRIVLCKRRLSNANDLEDQEYYIEELHKVESLYNKIQQELTTKDE